MKVFKPADTTHVLSIYPRFYVSNVDLYIRYELKPETAFKSVPTTTENGYLVGEFTYTFVEGGSYELEVFDSATKKLLYRGKAYATAQTDLENYKLTK